MFIIPCTTEEPKSSATMMIDNDDIDCMFYILTKRYERFLFDTLTKDEFVKFLKHFSSMYEYDDSYEPPHYEEEINDEYRDMIIDIYTALREVIEERGIYVLDRLHVCSFFDFVRKYTSSDLLESSGELTEIYSDEDDDDDW